MQWFTSSICLLILISALVTSAVSSSFSAQQSYPMSFDRTRITRGFKNGPLNTARGFGKRSLKNELIPLDWMAEEISTNPDLAKSFLRRYIDLDQDGFVSPLELLRPPNLCQDDN